MCVVRRGEVAREIRVFFRLQEREREREREATTQRDTRNTRIKRNDKR